MVGSQCLYFPFSSACVDSILPPSSASYERCAFHSAQFVTTYLYFGCPVKCLLLYPGLLRFYSIQIIMETIKIITCSVCNLQKITLLYQDTQKLHFFNVCNKIQPITTSCITTTNKILCICKFIKKIQYTMTKCIMIFYRHILHQYLSQPVFMQRILY